MNDAAIVPRANLDLWSDCFALGWTGLTVTGKPAFEEWATFGRSLRFAARAVAGWWGDWLNYGERAYGEKYAQAVDESDYELGTLKNFAWVCGSIHPSLRRDDLSFGHHACVAPLRYEDGSPDEEAQRHYLAVAADERLSVAELRQRIKEDAGEAQPPQPEPLLEGEFELGDISVDGARRAVVEVYVPEGVSVEALVPLVGERVSVTIRRELEGE